MVELQAAQRSEGASERTTQAMRKDRPCGELWDVCCRRASGSNCAVLAAFTNPGEQALDRWMRQHAFVTWMQTNHPRRHARPRCLTLPILDIVQPDNDKCKLNCSAFGMLARSATLNMRKLGHAGTRAALSFCCGCYYSGRSSKETTDSVTAVTR